MTRTCPECSSFAADDATACPKCSADLGPPPCGACGADMRSSGHTGVAYQCDDCGSFLRPDEVAAP